MKNKFRMFIVAFFTCIFIIKGNVYAFTSSNYYDNQNISVGLISKAGIQLTITLNGDYTLNGGILKNGTSYLLKVSGSQIVFNGVCYDSINFIPKSTLNTIKVVSNSSSYYLGTMAFKIDSSSGTNKVLPINTLYIEDYLKGVVGKEMSDYFPIEALKAQAIAARNYALASINKHNVKGYNLCDTTDCQVYGGYDASLKNVVAAVDDTKGMLLLSGTSIVEALYSASDGGFTEASENVWGVPKIYFKSKQDNFDINYPWNKKWTTASINTIIKIKPLLKIPANYTFVKIDLNTITKFDSGRIKNISLIFKDQNGDSHALAYGKDTARTFLSLPSALYNLSYDATIDTYSFDGKGNGHGIGMSQIGAMNRAAAGQSFEDILKFYYDGTTLLNVLPSINNISVDKDKIYSFDCPNFSVVATGGSGSGLTYKYVIEHNNATIYDSGFVSTSKFQYKPEEVGSYNLKVYLKDKDSIIPFEDTKSYSFTVESEALLTGLTATSGYNSILLNWAKNSDAQTSGYEVYMSTSSTGIYTLKSTTTEASYNNTGLTINSTYYYKVRGYRMSGTVKVYSNFSTIISSKPVNVQRLSGLNRIETSIAIAKDQYTATRPGAVVLATANNFADALAGSGLAYMHNAPLLLVNNTVSNSKNVLDYITTNLSKDKSIYILGGTGAISKEISDYLTVQGYKIVRLGGKDRYETNQEIVNYLNIAKGTSIVMATGSNFADALSISSIADIKGYPILLNGKDNLSTSVSNYITNIQPTTIYIIGGAGVLSANIETQLKSLDANLTIVRLGGKDRYETSMNIIEYFNLTTDTIAVATGIDFPDALSGSVLAARKNCNVLLVDNRDVTVQKALLDKQNITNVLVFGGEGVISNDISASLIQK